MTQPPLNPAPHGGQVLDLWACGLILWKRRRLVILLPLIGALVVGIVSLLLPKTFESTVVLMPLERPDLLQAVNTNFLVVEFLQRETLTRMGSMAQESPAGSNDFFPFSLLMSTERIGHAECIAILESKEMLDDNLREHGLWQDDEKILHELRLELQDDTQIYRKETFPTIEITVSRTDAQEAASMANFYAAHLSDMLNGNLNESRRNLRQYVEQQLVVLERLDSAADTSRTIDESPQDRRPEAQPKRGVDTTNDRSASLYGNLSRTIEWLRLTESAELPLIQVLDEAVPAVEKSSPRPVLNTLAAFVALIMLGTLLAFVMEYVESERVRRKPAGN